MKEWLCRSFFCLCVQCMHIGSYDDEPATVDEMHRFMEDRKSVV